MALNIKKTRTTKFTPQNQHNSFGIQNWLVKKGYILSAETPNKVDDSKYKELLKEFCLSNEKFDTSKVKGFHSYEAYTQDVFGKFCSFCNKKHKA